MTVDISQFHQFVREREEADVELAAFVQQLQLPNMQIQYEELQQIKEVVMQRLFSFLHVPEFTVQGRTKKHTSDDLRKVVLNFDELQASFAGTPYFEMFDEVAER